MRRTPSRRGRGGSTRRLGTRTGCAAVALSRAAAAAADVAASLGLLFSALASGVPTRDDFVCCQQSPPSRAVYCLHLYCMCSCICVFSPIHVSIAVQGLSVAVSLQRAVRTSGEVRHGREHVGQPVRGGAGEPAGWPAARRVGDRRRDDTCGAAAARSLRNARACVCVCLCVFVRVCVCMCVYACMCVCVCVVHAL